MSTNMYIYIYIYDHICITCAFRGSPILSQLLPLSTCVPHSMCLTNNHKVLQASRQRNISLHGGCMLGTNTWKKLKISHTGNGKRASRTGAGLYGIHPLQKTQKKKDQRFGTNSGQGGAAMVVFFVFFGFLSAFLSNRKPEKDKRTRRWEEIDMRNWCVAEINEEKGPAGKYQKLGAHSAAFCITVYIYIHSIYQFISIANWSNGIISTSHVVAMFRDVLKLRNSGTAWIIPAPAGLTPCVTRRVNNDSPRFSVSATSEST